MAEGQLGGGVAVHSALYQGQPPAATLQEVGQAQAAGCVCGSTRGTDRQSSETAAGRRPVCRCRSNQEGPGFPPQGPPLPNLGHCCSAQRGPTPTALQL